MAEKEAKFDKNGGPIEIDIEIGQSKTGLWTLFLFDKNKKRLLREEGDSAIATIPITNPLTDLDNALLMLDATINGANKPNQRWKVTMTIKQDGNPIQNGVFEYPDSDDPKTFKLVLVMKTKEVRLKAK